MSEIKLNPEAQKLAEQVIQILKDDSSIKESINKLEDSYPNNPMLNLITYIYNSLDDKTNEIERKELKVQLEQDVKAEFWLGNLQQWIDILETDTFSPKHIKAIFIEKYANQNQLEGSFLKSLKTQ